MRGHLGPIWFSVDRSCPYLGLGRLGTVQYVVRLRRLDFFLWATTYVWTWKPTYWKVLHISFAR